MSVYDRCNEPPAGSLRKEKLGNDGIANRLQMGVAAATLERTRGNSDETNQNLCECLGRLPSRHGGVGGLSRVTHDLLLSQYLGTEEAEELKASFAGKRKPDAAKFGH